MKKLYVFGSVIIIILLLIGIFYLRYSSEVDAFTNGVEISIRDTTIEQFQLDKSRLTLVVDVYNPTSEQISGFSAAFDIFLADSDIGDGAISNVDLPGKTAQTSTVNVTIDHTKVPGAILSAILSRDYTITLKGDMNGYVFFGLIPISEEFSAVYSA